MGTRSILLFTQLWLTACGGPPTEPATAQGQADDNASSAADHATADKESGSSAPRSTESSSAPRSDRAVAHGSSEPAAPGDAVDLGDFCSQHGIVANLNVERCVSTPLGAKPDTQLWCSRRDELDDNRVMYFVALYRVIGKQLSKVIELPYAVGPKPLEERPRDVTYYVKLFPDVADDATAFEMRNESGFNCDDAPKRVHDEYSNNPELAAAIEQAVVRVCSARGKYNASGKRQK